MGVGVSRPEQNSTSFFFEPAENRLEELSSDEELSENDLLRQWFEKDVEVVKPLSTDWLTLRAYRQYSEMSDWQHDLCKSTLAHLKEHPELEKKSNGDPTSFDRGQIALALSKAIALRLFDENRETNEYIRTHYDVDIDHYNIRTLDDEDVSDLLKALGYLQLSETYQFPDKKVSLKHAGGWVHPQAPHEIPKVFTSQWSRKAGGHSRELKELAKGVQESYLTGYMAKIRPYFERLKNGEKLDGLEAANFIAGALEVLSNNYSHKTVEDYDLAVESGADALAWIIANGQEPNHIAIAVDKATLHELHREAKLNGKNVTDIQVGAHGSLSQWSTKAQFGATDFLRMKVRIVPKAFIEFIHRDIDPLTGKKVLGFDFNNAHTILKHSATVNPF